MVTSTAQTVGRESARDIAVWDPLTRLIHWSLALTILLNATIIDAESATHAWIGYIALGLVGLRLLWALIGPEAVRFSAFPPSLMRAVHHVRGMIAGDHTIHLSHNPLGALMVYNIWLSVIAIGVTGYMMTTFRWFGIDWVEESHEAIFNWLVFSVALHVAGVFFETWRSGVNLLRSMITGTKSVPEGRDVE